MRTEHYVSKGTCLTAERPEWWRKTGACWVEISRVTRPPTPQQDASRSRRITYLIGYERKTLHEIEADPRNVLGLTRRAIRARMRRIVESNRKPEWGDLASPSGRPRPKRANHEWNKSIIPAGAD